MQTEQNIQAGERTQMIECGMEPHYNLLDAPILAGQSYFGNKNDKLVSVYEIDGVFGKWSNSTTPPPSIDSRVKINFNELGTGTVTGFFTESGWLGIYVKLDKEPAWRKKQSAAGKDAMVFGAEITQL